MLTLLTTALGFLGNPLAVSYTQAWEKHPAGDTPATTQLCQFAQTH